MTDTILRWFAGYALYCVGCALLFVLMLRLDGRRYRRERVRWDLLYDDDDPANIDRVIRRETALGMLIRQREQREGRAA